MTPKKFGLGGSPVAVFQWKLVLMMALFMVFSGDPVLGKDILLGTLPDPTKHDIRGDVYIRDATTLFLQNFHIDGKGPGIVYIVGKGKVPNESVLVDYTGYINSTSTTSKYGKKLPDGFEINSNMVLTLPLGHKINEFTYFSVYCDEAKADFGSIYFKVDIGEGGKITVMQERPPGSADSSLKNGFTSIIVVVFLALSSILSTHGCGQQF